MFILLTSVRNQLIAEDAVYDLRYTSETTWTKCHRATGAMWSLSVGVEHNQPHGTRTFYLENGPLVTHMSERGACGLLLDRTSPGPNRPVVQVTLKGGGP